MGVRADMTPQAARIDAHYLKRAHAARFCYVGPVLRARSDELAGSREPLQLGAELFGHSGPESDAEVLCLMLATLALTGIRAPHIDLAHVGVFRSLAARANLMPEQKGELLDAVERRARSEVEAMLSKWSAAAEDRKRIVALLDLSGDGDVIARARALYQGVPEALAAIDNLEAIARQAKRQVPSAVLRFDLAELGGYHYYTGAMFSAFVPGQGRAVAKGGRYDGIGRAFGRDRAATGFSADMRRLLKVGDTTADGVTGILAPADGDPALTAEVERLRAAGERVVCALPGDKGAPVDFDCDRKLIKKNGRWQVKPVTDETADKRR